jgi:hypothetical protein
MSPSYASIATQRSKAAPASAALAAEKKRFHGDLGDLGPSAHRSAAPTPKPGTADGIPQERGDECRLSRPFQTGGHGTASARECRARRSGFRMACQFEEIVSSAYPWPGRTLVDADAQRRHGKRRPRSGQKEPSHAKEKIYPISYGLSGGDDGRDGCLASHESSPAVVVRQIGFGTDQKACRWHLPFPCAWQRRKRPACDRRGTSAKIATDAVQNASLARCPHGEGEGLLRICPLLWVRALSNHESQVMPCHVLPHRVTAP